jgi:hypothetical protein
MADEPLSIDTLRAIARAQGLPLDGPALERVHALVTAARASMQPVRDAVTPDLEPIAHRS